MNKLADLISRWRQNPEDFVREAIGASPDPWQVHALQAIRDHKRISIAACHGVGKDTLAAWLALWVLLCFSFPKIVGTAPTAAQLYDLLLSECQKWRMKMHPAWRNLFEQTSDRIYRKAYPNTWFLTARVSRKESPESLAGIHADHVLLLVDEASGVPDVIFEVLEGAMTGPWARQLLIGNPTQTSGYFHGSHHQDRDRWYRMTIASTHAWEMAFGDDKSYPGLWLSDRPSKEYVEGMAKRYGVESNVFRVRCLGLFPKSEDDQTIPLEWVEAAAMREPVAQPSAALTVGGDIARFGDDDTAYIVRRGRSVLEIAKWHGNDIAQSTGRFVALGNRLSEQLEDGQQLYFYIDSTGLGSGVCDHLRAYVEEHKKPWIVIDVDAGARSPDEHRLRMRDALWWRAREWFRVGEPAISQAIDPDLRLQLIGELSAPKYEYTPSGEIKVEPKDELKKRGVASPNLADALIHTMLFDAQNPEPDETPRWMQARWGSDSAFI